VKISTRRHIGQHKISLDNHFFYKEQPTSNQEVQIQHGHYQNTLASAQRSNYSRNRQLGEKQVWSNTTQLKEIRRSSELSGLSTPMLSARLGLGRGSVALKKAVVLDCL
jgi:hypothetical protein